MVQKTEQHFTVISLPQTGAGCDGGESSTVYSQALERERVNVDFHHYYYYYLG